MAKLDWEKVNRQNREQADRNKIPDNTFNEILKTARKLELEKEKADRKEAGLPVIGIFDLDTALDWVLFNTSKYSPKPGVDKLAEVKKFVNRYMKDKKLNEEQTLLVFRNVLLKQNILENFDESKGKLTTFIITILYNKFFSRAK